MVAFSPCVLLVKPQAGTQVDTADFLRHSEWLLGFSGRPRAASWRERHQVSAAFLLVRSREALDRLALTAVIRCGVYRLAIDPDLGTQGSFAMPTEVDLRAWLRTRLPWSATLYEFARVRGWQAQVDALLEESADTPEKSSI
jgi:hypothetical protein